MRLSAVLGWARIRSLVHLALGFWSRRWRRLRYGAADDGGEALFLQNYAGEGMAPLSLEHQAHILATSRCIHCGLCEAVCPEPADLWASYSRALASAGHAAAVIPSICPPGCGACARICPTGVPLSDIPAFVHRSQGAKSSSGA